MLEHPPRLGAYLDEARSIERRVEMTGDLMTAHMHRQLDDDVALARLIGIPEPTIQAEQRRVLFDFAQVKAELIERQCSNLFRELMRRFKAAYLAAHPLCLRCVTTQGRVRPAIELRHIVVTGGDPAVMFNPHLIEGLCGTCSGGLSRYRAPDELG